MQCRIPMYHVWINAQKFLESRYLYNDGADLYAHFGKIWVGNRQNGQEIFNFFNDCVKFLPLLAIFYQMSIMPIMPIS